MLPPRRRIGAWSFAMLLVLGACSSGDEPLPGLQGAASPEAPAVTSDADVADAAAAKVAERLELFEDLYPGALTLIRVGEETRFVTAGYADVRARTSMTDRHRFQVGSVTKTMVATAVMQLVEEDELRLSDPVERWLPGVVRDGDQISVELLLSHRSGIYNYTDSPRFRWHGPWEPMELVRLGTDPPASHPPDSTGSYSNTNYLLLGLILEEATGQPLETVLQQRVFAPLAMDDTSLAADRVTEPPLVRGYEGRRDVTLDELGCCWGAGGVVSSARDLTTFLRALVDGRLLRPETVRDMSSSRGSLGNRIEYGLGVGRLATPCGPALGHGGGLPGFATEAWTSEDGTRSAVILMNDVGSADITGQLVAPALCT